MTDDAEMELFLGYLRTALNQLYEPRTLRAGPLPALFGLQDQRQDVAALQTLLTDAIEALRPTPATPQDSGSWRLYRILRLRYTEQVPQTVVAGDMGLSVRHVQREEKQARELLADYLWKTHHLVERRHLLADVAAPPDDAPEDAAPTRVQELELLRDSDPPQITDVQALILAAVETARPLFQALGIQCEVDTPADLPPARARPLLIEQGLLGVLTAAAEAQVARALYVEAAAEGDAVAVTVSSRATLTRLRHDDLASARQLIDLAGGTLVTPDDLEGPASDLPLTIRLPQARQDTVLLIDDNADALQLLQRYLSGTPYRAVALRDPAQAIALAEELRPRAIVLDVMMPGRDGWALLGQFREHPQLHAAAIIVCTVLPQERLARTLGATEFLRKPVHRATLLATLDRLLAPAQTAAA